MADTQSASDSCAEDLCSSNIHIFRKMGEEFVFAPDSMEVISPTPLQKSILLTCQVAKPYEKVVNAAELSGFDAKSVFNEIIHLSNLGFLGTALEPEIVSQASQSMELVLNVAQACNLGCAYCFSNNNINQYMTPDMATKSVDAFLDRYQGLDSFKLSFFGGEPFLNFKTIKHAVLYAKQKASKIGLDNLQYFVITNATRLTPEIIDFLDEHAFEVQVSIDGEKEIHDELRTYKNGRGSFDIVYRAFQELLNRQNIKVSTSSVIRPGNTLATAYEYLDPYDIENMKLDIVIDFHDENTRSVDSISDDFIDKHLEDLEILGLDYVEKLVNWIKPAEYNFKQSLLLLWQKKKKESFCPASTSRFGVAPQGEIHPCGAAASLREYRLGTVEKGFDSKAIEHFRSKLDFSKHEPCKSCWAKPLCMGGCPLTVRTPPVRRHCKIKKAMAEVAIAIFAKVRSKNPFSFVVLADQDFANKVRKLVDN